MADIEAIKAEVEGRRNTLHANGGEAYAEACALYWPTLLAEIERLRGILAQIRVSQDPIEMVGLAALATEQLPACEHDWEQVNPNVIDGHRCMKCGAWR